MERDYLELVSNSQHSQYQLIAAFELGFTAAFANLPVQNHIFSTEKSAFYYLHVTILDHLPISNESDVISSNSTPFSHLLRLFCIQLDINYAIKGKWLSFKINFDVGQRGVVMMTQ
jgi:hypothetical protein